MGQYNTVLRNAKQMCVLEMYKLRVSCIQRMRGRVGVRHVHGEYACVIYEELLIVLEYRTTTLAAIVLKPDSCTRKLHFVYNVDTVSWVVFVINLAVTKISTHRNL